jgi:hypothetical protein
MMFKAMGAIRLFLWGLEYQVAAFAHVALDVFFDWLGHYASRLIMFKTPISSSVNSVFGW